MISDAEVILNRCGREGCGIVAAFMLRRQTPFMVAEFAGNTPCESITGHDMSEWTRVTISRDILILRALWTTGQAVTPGLLSDPTSHILADMLGWSHGDPAHWASLPDWLRDGPDLTWPAQRLASRVARASRDDWPTDSRHYRTWARITDYLDMWADKIL